MSLQPKKDTRGCVCVAMVVNGRTIRRAIADEETCEHCLEQDGMEIPIDAIIIDECEYMEVVDL